MLRVLDLFSAAAGGWSLGMHRAGFTTVAACEVINWRRALYAQNNPGVVIYDDVRTLSADRLVSDLGYLPSVIVGSPPCQDISSANTKGKGVEGERSGLYFEAIRIIGEVRPRWFALENSANLRTRGADRVLTALEAIGYSCWPFVVRAGHGRGGAGIGANHERPRSWLIGCDLDQIAHADGFGRDAGRQGRRSGLDLSLSNDPLDAPSVGHEGGRPRRRGPNGIGAASDKPSDAGNADSERRAPWREDDQSEGRATWIPSPRGDRDGRSGDVGTFRAALRCADDADSVGGRPQRLAGRDEQRDSEGTEYPNGLARQQMGRCQTDCGNAPEPWSDWNGGLARHLRVDDGLSTWVAGTRIAVGGPRGTSAASLIVEAFGDSVLPQIPEAIGRAILRTEAALSAIYWRAA
jgi:DNA (cytosine-5)-methyltransferase 1